MYNHKNIKQVPIEVVSSLTTTTTTTTTTKAPFSISLSSWVTNNTGNLSDFTLTNKNYRRNGGTWTALPGSMMSNETLDVEVTVTVAVGKTVYMQINARKNGKSGTILSSSAQYGPIVNGSPQTLYLYNIPLSSLVSGDTICIEYVRDLPQ